MFDATLVKALERSGIRDARVVEAMAGLDRRDFVPAELRDDARGGEALSIGHGQTISQPYIVAYMSEALQLCGDEKVLEIGTGSAYQAAVLAGLAREVWTVERIPQLAWSARERLLALGLGDVHVCEGDGFLGLPAQAPFDAIIVTAAAPYIPHALVDQLAPGGRMLLPVGEPTGPQVLQKISRRVDGTLSAVRLLDVKFVPMLPGLADAPRA
jgi:protein-L-isoaspartate(D-aspartate) O-methyltransferase